MIKKERKNALMKWADETLRESSIYERNTDKIVSESYNGHIAAFSVSVALSGLKPAMALYHSGKGSSDVDKKEIIKLLAVMYNKDNNTRQSADDFYNMVIGMDASHLSTLRRDILEYAIALKLAIRTFKFN